MKGPSLHNPGDIKNSSPEDIVRKDSKGRTVLHRSDLPFPIYKDLLEKALNFQNDLEYYKDNFGSYPIFYQKDKDIISLLFLNGFKCADVSYSMITPELCVDETKSPVNSLILRANVKSIDPLTLYINEHKKCTRTFINPKMTDYLVHMLFKLNSLTDNLIKKLKADKASPEDEIAYRSLMNTSILAYFSAFLNISSAKSFIDKDKGHLKIGCITNGPGYELIAFRDFVSIFNLCDSVELVNISTMSAYNTISDELGIRTITPVTKEDFDYIIIGDIFHKEFVFNYRLFNKYFNRGTLLFGDDFKGYFIFTHTKGLNIRHKGFKQFKEYYKGSSWFCITNATKQFTRS